MIIGEYSVEHFQGLPTLEDARTKFTALGGDELVKTVFRNFFIAHSMENKFGLSMLHRHFDLSPGEMLVDYDGTSVPWPEGSIRGMKRPQPAVWAYSPAGHFRPTEFRYSEKDDLVMGESELRFMDMFKDLINQYNAVDLFGLCRYPGDDFGVAEGLDRSRHSLVFLRTTLDSGMSMHLQR
ncbi:hypothetical protein QQZ08_010256 [Neonectria magnoliae]|uniref:Uncharacterized protein n=1 Tax=Neonectria magnoliae TaxID=2732573 RepID=A0ABR1HJK3_9HYPO